MIFTYPGKGDKWCAIGKHPMDLEKSAVVGVGNGHGDGADGHFACIECYRWNSGQPIVYRSAGSALKK